MADDKNWIKAGSTDNMWNGGDLKEGASVEGVYVKKRTNVGKHDSNVYHLETDKGEVGIWGSTVLNAHFDEIAIGSEVQIKFLGLEKTKDGTEFKNYQVRYTIAKADTGESKGGDTAAGNVDKVFPDAEEAPVDDIPDMGPTKKEDE